MLVLSALVLASEFGGWGAQRKLRRDMEAMGGRERQAERSAESRAARRGSCIRKAASARSQASAASARSLTSARSQGSVWASASGSPFMSFSGSPEPNGPSRHGSARAFALPSTGGLTAWSALRSGKGARGTMRSVFFGGPPPRARTEPRGERGADVLENGRNGDVRAPRRQCSAQI